MTGGGVGIAGKRTVLSQTTKKSVPHTPVPMHEAETRCVYVLDALQTLCVSCQRANLAGELRP